MDVVRTRRILSIQSHVVHGYVGNKSATFPLQLLGFDVDPLNSVQFSNHTGYSTFRGQVLNEDELIELFEGLVSNNLHCYSHLLTGYIGSKSFLMKVKDVILKLRHSNPNLIYVCDPVLGDNGQLYVPEELTAVYRDHIIPMSDIITPNQYEAELITGRKIDSLKSVKEAIQSLHDLGAKTVIMSSAHVPELSDDLVGFASTLKNGPSSSFMINIKKLPMNFTGTGDLLAALLLAWMDKHPHDLKTVCEKVMSTMHHVLQRTYDAAKEAGSDHPMHCELRMVQSKRDIEEPKICCEARRLDEQN